MTTATRILIANTHVGPMTRFKSETKLNRSLLLFVGQCTELRQICVLTVTDDAQTSTAAGNECGDIPRVQGG